MKELNRINRIKELWVRITDKWNTALYIEIIYTNKTKKYYWSSWIGELKRLWETYKKDLELAVLLHEQCLLEYK